MKTFNIYFGNMMCVLSKIFIFKVKYVYRE